MLISCHSDVVTNATKTILLSGDWKIQQSTKINSGGEEISSARFSTTDWYPAAVPTTVMGALCEAGMYPDIMKGINMKNVDTTLFDSSWWFRNEFQLPPLKSGQQVHIHFDGISYRANIWLNGIKIAGTDVIEGAFRQFTIDISSYLRKNIQNGEKNVLAVEVFKAQDGDPNIGFVDWNPRPADENMGIFREVSLQITEEVLLKNSAVKSKVNTKTLNEAWLTVETELINSSDKTIKGILTGKMENMEYFSHPVVLKPKEKKIIRLSSDDYHSLHIYHPRIWWCNNLGKPEMYEMQLSFQIKQKISDEQKIKFGVREIKDYFTEDNQRGFILNGKKILIKSGGWTDDIFLRDTDERNEIQIRYVKDMNLNSIRLENIWGKNQKLYDLCDENGIMVLTGWSCHWEWEDYLKGPVDEFGGIITEKQMDLIAQSFEDQILWLRNHPSIIAWFVGSDKMPRPGLEEKYQEILGRIDDRPYIAAAANSKSEVTGPTGMKMNGPYEYVGPNYWYEDRHFGGAYGFNTETGIGAQLPLLESIKKFIPEDKLWPVNNEYWDYYCTASSSAMNNLSVLTNVINNKYGQANSIEEYVRKAHVIDYEGTKAMFESFRTDIPCTTGIVQWMLNSAWPSLYWQLYDYYLVPTAGYYAVKKANQPQQLIYNYKENAIYGVNELINKKLAATMICRVFSFDSQLLYSSESAVEIEPNSSKPVMLCKPLTQNVFISLQLKGKGGEIISENFYWAPVENDLFDWKSTTWVHTPTLKYSNLKALNNIPSAKLSFVSINYILERGKKQTKIVIKNESDKIAFFNQFLVKDESGEIVAPIEWSDNYISFLPGEEKVLKCHFDKEKNVNYSLEMSGWNVEKQEVKM
jgi:exo-1,4-beta-D-glucosaminidase